MPSFTALKQIEAVLNSIRLQQVTSEGNVVDRSSAQSVRCDELIRTDSNDVAHSQSATVDVETIA